MSIETGWRTYRRPDAKSGGIELGGVPLFLTLLQYPRIGKRFLSQLRILGVQRLI
ncbi:hypothetical protein AMTR_s00071p00078420 [Amborella trichopoda]|uniref:Uncharacterized protein n=1 Tax=Amborella trichopoda TaxID=13333 RepID=U5DCE2_AMBTC|nr:hypothetical protein AMTR_s00071p00078420 [Amborella trichopoda]